MTNFQSDVEKAAAAYVLPEGVSLAAVSIAFKAGAQWARERGFAEAVKMLQSEEGEFEDKISFEGNGHTALWWSSWLKNKRKEMGK